MKRHTLSLAIILLLPVFLFAAQPLAPKYSNNTPAVNFRLTDLNNQKVSLSDLKGKPVILFFWTTWCPFCREELKVLNNMYRKIQGDGIELLAVNVGEEAAKVKGFAEKNFLTYRILVDKDRSVAHSYKVLGVPTYVLINNKANIVSSSHFFPREEYKYLTAE